jgi:ribosomal protein L28
MAKTCYICGKGTMSGINRRHKHSVGWKYEAPRNTRKWKVNGRKAKVVVKSDGKEEEKKIFVCMKCYKKLRKAEEYKGVQLAKFVG